MRSFCSASATANVPSGILWTTNTQAVYRPFERVATDGLTPGPCQLGRRLLHVHVGALSSAGPRATVWPERKSGEIALLGFWWSIGTDCPFARSGLRIDKHRADGLGLSEMFAPICTFHA